ncbi:MAG: glycerol-3-phosphate 1-O-acyltransferase PlsY [Clostridia bacterium]|nr:glycerol-3-phosphate 1-O-acyltransferase PlsY [Clostridia bacterium]
MTYLIIIAVAVVSYLIGSINFSIILSKIISGKDIRESGSGNAGATNMLRTHGKKMGVLTLLLDVAKGVICVLIAILYIKYINAPNRDYVWGRSDLAAYRNMFASIALPYIAGVCVILGHNFPVYFGFKGGKGVATSLGVVLMLDWKVGLIVAVIALAVMAITRYVSLGSIIGGAAYIIIEIVKAIVLNDYNAIQIVCVVVIGGLLILRHHANIKRLLNGTENKLGSKKEK